MEHHPTGSQSFSQQLGSQRGALGKGPADQQPSGGLGALVRYAVSDVSQG